MKSICSFFLLFIFINIQTYSQDQSYYYHSIQQHNQKTDENSSFQEVKSTNEIIKKQDAELSSLNSARLLTTQTTELKNLRLGFNTGFTYLLAPIEDGTDLYKEYAKKLKMGYHFGMDGQYFFQGKMGVGVKASICKTKSSMENIYLTDGNGNMKFADVSEKISITTIGPAFTSRFLLSNYNIFLLHYSIGYLHYKDDADFGEKYTVDGNSFYLGFDLGYDIILSENMALGFQASLFLGSISKITVDDGSASEIVNLDDDSYIGTSRVDLSIGLRFLK